MEFNKKDAVWKTAEIRNLLVDDISRKYRDYYIVFCDGKLFESGKWNGVEIIS